MAGGVDTQGSVLRPQPWAGESQHLQSCRSLCKSPSPNPPQGREFHIKPHSNPSKAFFKVKEFQQKPPSQLSPRGRSSNYWPIPAFFKVKVFQQKPLPTFHKGKERHPSALNTAGWDSRPLGRVGEGLQLRVIQGLLPLAMPMEDYLPMTNSRVPPAMMSA